MITAEYKDKLTSRLFGLLCEYEKDREWRKFLETITIELMGFSEEDKNAEYYHLVHNLASCRYLSYDDFRSTIFDGMNVVEKL